MRIAVAAMVKTPGLSRVKTRLANDTGAAVADEFYRLSVVCIEELLAGFDECSPFWAVAEPDGTLDPLWRRFPVVSQGQGGLGDRMHQVYSTLLNDFDAVFLIGADSPQLTTRHFDAASARLRGGADFVFGPAEDGGFYLLAGCTPISKEVFNRVEYSAADTLVMLEAELIRIGAVARIGAEPDVDTVHDLPKVSEKLGSTPDRTAAQERLMAWLRDRTPEARDP